VVADDRGREAAVSPSRRSGMLEPMPDISRSTDTPPQPTLTPLGPGGRPFARWRGLASVLALVAMVATVAVLLSARAPGILDDVSDGISTRLDQRAPEARDAAERAVRRTGVEEPDALAHIGLWAGAMVLAGLATWSWGSLAAVVLVVFAGSTGLEVVQEQVSPTRITERSDLVANAVGIGVGLALVVAITIAGGLPAHARRWKLRRQ
jgi:hypothetical protein